MIEVLLIFVFLLLNTGKSQRISIKTYAVVEDFRHQLNWALYTWEILLKSKKKIYTPSLEKKEHSSTIYNKQKKTQKQSSSAEL